MSRSPTDASESAVFDDENHPYRKSWRRMNDLIRQGRSWSGNEANCCLLNLGNGRFVDVSAASGFDFHGDGRALAVTDWDHDGDLDVWLTNRTGPRLQMLRNESTGGHHFLALRLEGNGSTSNRDAIGARVEIVYAGSSKQRLIRTLRAGSGFLSQSSKWLFFGLGQTREIEKIRVRWPDGSRQELAGVAVDGHYDILQGRSETLPWIPPPIETTTKTSSDSPQIAVSGDGSAAVMLQLPMPLPALQWETMTGETSRLADHAGQPVLLNLWASWCRPCLAELAEMARHEKRLRAVGLDVIALSVDGLDGKPVDRGAAQKIVDNMGFPFVAARASKSLVDKLHLIHARLFEKPAELPVPTSFLIDRRGRIAAVYRGAVTIDRLIDDVRRLDQQRPATPFVGRWFATPAPHRLVPLAWQLFDNGHVAEAIAYVEQNKRRLKRESEPEYVRLLTKRGIELMKRGADRLAAGQFQEVLRIAPDQPSALNNLAWLLATSPDKQVREGQQALRLAQRAASLTKRREATVLATLAAAYAEAGRFPQATATANEALALTRKVRNKVLESSLLQQLESYAADRPFRAIPAGTATGP
ncbi:MAG: ASPIC/UnbV domain-containing protein [Planctomycetes bacterium]|nr:ASPIC/UnbV domain-containing protein [Planctomycetota bacterium]